MFDSYLTLRGASQTITGSLGSKFLHCMMRPAQGGALPPAGEYQILPPMSDPIYGTVALMVPAGGHAPDMSQKPLAMQKIFAPGLLAMDKVIIMPPSSTGGGSVSAASDRAEFLKYTYEAPSSAAGGQVFVLSDQPVLGRNSIVVSSGFADLLDGLQASGGARVTVI